MASEPRLYRISTGSVVEVVRKVQAGQADGLLDRDNHLQAGPLRVPVRVDDAPFVVVRAEPGADPDTIEVHLSDGSQEPLEAGSLVLDRRGIPYCRVKGGRFRARFSVSAWLQLAEKVEVDPGSGEPALVLGGRRFVLRGAE